MSHSGELANNFARYRNFNYEHLRNKIDYAHSHFHRHRLLEIRMSDLLSAVLENRFFRTNLHFEYF